MGAGPQLGLSASVALVMLAALAVLIVALPIYIAEELMVTGYGRLERVVRLWLPDGFSLVLSLFPVYWMAITSIKPNAELYNTNVMPLDRACADAEALRRIC